MREKKLTETVELAAAAAYEWCRRNWWVDPSKPWGELTDAERKPFLGSQRAAIAALREPTNAMLHAATMEVPTWDDNASKRKWQAMIDAALGEGGNVDSA